MWSLLKSGLYYTTNKLRDQRIGHFTLQEINAKPQTILGEIPEVWRPACESGTPVFDTFPPDTSSCPDPPSAS